MYQHIIYVADSICHDTSFQYLAFSLK